MERIVVNPGSTIGEALGTLVELEVNRLLRPIAEENGCVYVTAGPMSIRTGQPTKLLLKDTAGIEYQIDAIIANTRMQPLILVESKYIILNITEIRVAGSVQRIIACDEHFQR